MTRRLRQVVDLYTTGVTVPLKDGTPVWMQVLNPFENDTARNEATIAKARLTFALKDYGADEQTKVRMFFFQDGTEGATEALVEAKVAARVGYVLDGIRNDPEWTEKMLVLDRGLEDTAKPLEEAEQEAWTALSTEYAKEVAARLDRERDFFESEYEAADEETLWQDYLEWYIERRTNEVATAEYRLHQLYFGARVCLGEQVDGVWKHDRCEGHRERLFLDKEEAREAPEELATLLLEALDGIDLTVREAKNSDRQGSSSDSSPLPSEVEESTASIPTETPVAPLGSSPSPYPTPSPSLASTS